MRPISAATLALCLLAGLPRAARGDVVILKGNDVPLTGRILREDEEVVRFWIKGLGRGSQITIEKSRIKRYWREENTYWDYVQAEEKRRAALTRLKAPPEDLGAGATFSAPPPAPARTGSEIRRAILERALDRAGSLIPDHSLLRLLVILAGLGGVTLLLYAGSRVADLPRLGLGKAALLAVVTQLFVALSILAPEAIIRPETLPLVVASEALAWVLIARLLSAGTLSKAVLLLSFFLAAVFLIGSSAFSVLTAM